MAGLTVDELFMMVIERKYSEAETTINELMLNLGRIKIHINEHYLGMATDINNAGLEKYMQHIDYLRLCCRNTRDYVKFSKELLARADEVEAQRARSLI